MPINEPPPEGAQLPSMVVNLPRADMPTADLGAGPIVPRYDRGYDGAGTAPFSDEAQAILLAPVDPREVEVRPDGIVYLPWIHWAGRLNRAFGVGGWTIVPRDRPQRQGPIVLYNGALYILGRFVREAWGECKYQEGNAGMSYGDALEGAQSDCLVRCAKYLGIGREMWDANWREPFLAGACSKAWLADKRQWLYWRNDRATPWQVEKANARPSPASDLPQDDPRVETIRRAMRPEFDLAGVTELLKAEQAMVPVGESRPVHQPREKPEPVEVVKGMTEAQHVEPTAAEIAELFPPDDAAPPKPTRTRTRKPDPPPEPGKISAAQHRALEAAITDYATCWGLNPEATRQRLKDHCGTKYSVEHFPELTPTQFDEIMREVLIKRPRRNGEGR